MIRNHPSIGPLRQRPPEPEPSPFALVAVLMLIVIALWSCVTDSEVDRLEKLPLTTAVVKPGDTWADLASDCPGSFDQRVLIEWLQEHSPISDDMLRVGDTVTVCANTTAPEIAEPCVVYSSPLAGWDYREGEWFDRDGNVVGESKEEDEPIYSKGCSHEG